MEKAPEEVMAELSTLSDGPLSSLSGSCHVEGRRDPEHDCPVRRRKPIARGRTTRLLLSIDCTIMLLSAILTLSVAHAAPMYDSQVKITRPSG